jgi:hypothetical protein
MSENFLIISSPSYEAAKRMQNMWSVANYYIKIHMIPNNLVYIWS